ncbi:MAG TPA: hypothetical protein VIG74_04415 [Alphaproteobacteria bacterium]
MKCAYQECPYPHREITPWQTAFRIEPGVIVHYRACKPAVQNAIHCTGRIVVRQRYVLPAVLVLVAVICASCSSLQPGPPADPSPQKPLWRCYRDELVKVIGFYDESREKYRVVIPSMGYDWLPVPVEQVRQCKARSIMRDASQAGWSDTKAGVPP